MQTDEYQLQLGWQGDDGLGIQLIQQILAGTKTATCCPKGAFTEKALATLVASKGKIVAVVDLDGKVHCHVRMIDVFETTFGHPDPRLVRGEGDGDDVGKFKHDHSDIWADEMAATGQPLTGETVLIAEEFELVAEDDKPQLL
ncbi:MAG: hypothetical protein ABI456_02795 [Ktedonobacteraceae bacterium]|nr:ASCH domain-containing protein [Chloroflexota bacterium]